MPDNKQTTGFDLNQHILQWRQTLAAKGTFSEDRLSELESHLHDSIRHWAGKGLTVEESFWIARSRTGSPEALAAEFAKIEPATVWRNRVFWILIGLTSSAVLSSFTQFLTNLLVCWMSPPKPGLHPTNLTPIWTGQIAGILITVFIFVTLSRSRLLHRLLSRQCSQRAFALLILLTALSGGGLAIAGQTIRNHLMNPEIFHTPSEAFQFLIQQKFLYVGWFGWPLVMALLAIYLSPLKGRAASRSAVTQKAA